MIRKYSYRILYATVLSGVTLMVHETGSPIAPVSLSMALALAFAILIVDWVVASSPSLYAQIYCERSRIGVGLAALSCATGTLLIYRELATHVPQPFRFHDLAYALQGVLVGVTLKTLVTAYFNRSLRNGPVELQRVLLLSSVAVLFCLLPTDDMRLQGIYLWGLALGLLVYGKVRGKEDRSAKRDRLLQNLLVDALKASERLNPIEWEAIRAFANEQWTLLDRYVEMGRRKKSTVLVLVHACRLRLLGRFDEALRVLQAEIDRPGRETKLEHDLYLQKGLNHGEKGELEHMNNALELAISLQPKSPLANLALAQRRSEQFSVSELISPDHALDEKTQEIRRRCAIALSSLDQPESQKLFNMVAGTTIPLTCTFLIDAHASVLMRTGFHTFSQNHLHQCIDEDPTFSAPYLHLGEWYIIELAKIQRSATDHEENELRTMAARLLRIALKLERGADTLVARRARHFLDVLKAGGAHKGGPQDPTPPATDHSNRAVPPVRVHGVPGAVA